MTPDSPEPIHREPHPALESMRWPQQLLLCALLPCLLFVAARWLPHASPGWLAALIFVFALPVVLGAWHRELTHSAVSALQFKPGRALHWLTTRRQLARLRDLLLSLALAGAVLMLGASFDAQDWVIVFLMPLVFVAARAVLDTWICGQFVNHAFGRQAQARVAGWVVVSVFWIAYVVAMINLPPQVDAHGLVERVEVLQAQWRDAPNATVRWVLDAIAWINATDAALTHATDERNWRLLVSLIAAPLTTATYLALAFHGLTLGRAERRRVLRAELSVEDEPPVLGPLGAGVLSALAVISLMILVSLVGAIDQQLKDKSNPFEAKLLPNCESIEGKVYKLGTWEKLQELAGRARQTNEAVGAAYCTAVKEAEAAGEAAVDRYLDWYFSLGAELMRLLSVFTGDTEQLLKAQFNDTLAADPRFGALLERLGKTAADSHGKASELEGWRATLLKDNVIVSTERQCSRIVRHEFALPGNQELFDLRASSSAGSGLAVGTVAGVVATKAMSKTAMKSAAKVLAKAVAKQGTKGVAVTAAGAAIGSIIPGAGTFVGALIGGIVGIVTTVAVDVALLAAEEQLSRADMKRELLDAVREGVDSSLVGVDCAR